MPHLRESAVPLPSANIGGPLFLNGRRECPLPTPLPDSISNWAEQTLLDSKQLDGRDAIQFNLDSDESGTFGIASLIKPVREDQAAKVVTWVGEDRA